MEVLKRPEQLCRPDPRNRLFVVMDPRTPGGTRPSTVEDRYMEMAALELPAGIPERIASAFAIARNLWTYGWFYWPFYALAGFQAYRCIEAALFMRYQSESDKNARAKSGKPALKALLRMAIDKAWIKDEGFHHFRDLAERRRYYEEIVSEIRGLPPPDDTRSPTEYSEQLARKIPAARNLHAHANAPTTVLFGRTRLDLELARDVIVQVLISTGEAV